MTRISLEKRLIDCQEWMDVPDCDPVRLANTYHDFDAVNAILSGWYGLYRKYVRPAIRSAGGTATILDIGCGGGDILRHLLVWSKRDGLTVLATGADPDERAIEYAQSVTPAKDIRFIAASSEKIVGTGEQFDIIISNHVLHHLADKEVTALCQDSVRLATRLALHADICRSPIAYATFPLIGGLFRNSFILEDGLLSIRRSFTPTELLSLAPEGWNVRTGFPFRCLLLWTP